MFRTKTLLPLVFILLIACTSCATSGKKIHKFKKKHTRFRNYDCGCMLVPPKTYICNHA